MTRAVAICVLAAPLLCAQGVIQGVVVNSITRTPIAGAAVKLSSGNKGATSTYSNANGDFRFSDLPPAEYELLAEADGYFSSDAYADSPAQLITSAAETRTASLELPPATRFGGRVLDGEGRPMPGVRVELITRSGRQGSMSMVTDKDGAYRTLDLLPGAYFLLARPDRGLGNKPQPKPAASDGDKKSWAATFYPNVSDFAAATPVVARGGDRPGYDIRLRSTPVFRIRGLALDEAGRPLGGVALSLRGANIRHYNLTHPDAQTVSTADGAFEFTEIGPGDWRIDGTKGQQAELAGFTMLTVTRHDEEQARVHLAPPFDVEGIVKTIGEGADAKPFPLLSGKGKGPNRPGVGLVAVAAPDLGGTRGPVEANGSFRIAGAFAGRYRIIPSPAPGFYVSQILQGAQDVSGQDVELAAGSPPLTIVFRADPGGARGQVNEGSGASVIFFPRGTVYTPWSDPNTARCDKDGKFELSGLAPGDYAVVAFPRIVEPDLLLEPTFIQQVTRGAPIVRVEPGKTAPLDLRLTSWPD